MRPLSHPAIEDVTVEGILHALSDPVRVAIFADIAGSGGQTCSSFLQVNERAIPKSTLSLHFKVLRDAGLIRGERQGVEMLNTSRCAEIDRRFPGLIKAIVAAHRVQLESASSRSNRRTRRKAGRRAAKTK
jgi:DNA-binding transcriptional ArsR family regulator